MSAERRCICGHHEQPTHFYDGGEEICLHQGCKCNKFTLWEVTFRDPYGHAHKVSDVKKFVETRDDLFDDYEREVHGAKTKTGKRSAQAYTLAEVGLSNLITCRLDSWHGWTLMTLPKTYIEPK